MTTVLAKERVHIPTENSSELRNNIIQVSLKSSVLTQPYYAIYENSPDLFRTVNTKGIILNCNKSYARTLGYSKKELIGMSIFDMVADESLEEMRDSFETWKKDGHVKNREVWLKRKDGLSFPVLLSASNLCDDDGNIIGSNTVLRDMTEFYNMRRKIEQINEKLEKEIKEKEEFIHLITNEVKSSIVSVRNITNTLLPKSDMLDRDQIEKLENIKFKSQSVVKMLSDLADITKIEHGSISLTKNQCDISALIINVISKLKEDADHHGSKILTEIPSRIDCICDKEKIEKVLTHVITNAIDYTPKGEGKVCITADYEGTEYVKIEVRDNGIGIKSEDIDKIFAKFYQIDISVLREHRGAGLGLSYCKRMIESHKGKIWAESKGFDWGTTIHILLPITDKNYYVLRKVE